MIAGILRRGLQLGNVCQRQHPLRRGMVAWWIVLPGLSGGGKMYDLVRGAHLDRTNAPQWIGPHGRPGGRAAVMTESSNDRYLTGPFTAISTSSPFSVGIWLSLTSASGTQTAFSLVDTTNNLAIAIMIRSGSPLKVEGWGSLSNPTLESGVTPVANTWYRVDYTWDGTTSRIYVNGVEKANNTAAPQSFTPTIASIGKFSTSFDNWTGWLDDATVFNYCLSPDTIWALYDSSRQDYGPAFRRQYWPLAYAAAAAAAGQPTMRRLGLSGYCRPAEVGREGVRVF